jgi:hypothetical protein
MHRRVGVGVIADNRINVAPPVIDLHRNVVS